MIKIFSNFWMVNFSVTSGNNKSFGPITISDFYAALKVVLSGKQAVTEIEKWIKETGFLSTFPPELICGHTEEAFARILNEYNKGVEDFLSKNTTFYLWLQSSTQ